MQNQQKNNCNLLEIHHIRWQCPHSMVALMLFISGMLVCRKTTHLKTYQSLEALCTCQARRSVVCFQETCWGPQKCIHQMSIEHIFHLSVLFLHFAPQQVKSNLCVHLGCELGFFVTFCDSFAFLSSINYCSVLVSVSLEGELEAVFPSSSFFSLLIFKVAKCIPRWVLGALLAWELAIHNCLLSFDFFIAVQHLPTATSTLSSDAWPST